MTRLFVSTGTSGPGGSSHTLPRTCGRYGPIGPNCWVHGKRGHRWVEEEVAEDEEREPLCLCEYWDRTGVSLEQS